MSEPQMNPQLQKFMREIEERKQKDAQQTFEKWAAFFLGVLFGPLIWELLRWVLSRSWMR